MDYVVARNVPEAYSECVWRMKVCGKPEDTRNGPVLAMPGPFMLTITNPWERVLFDPVRRANPYFHLIEFIWMMAGSRDARWLSQFNKKMIQYSDDGVNNYGSYGFRWREHFNMDQIQHIADILSREPTTRRAVMSMWDPEMDLLGGKDLPCNTTIYFRLLDWKLDMTVCNRSNDLIWGMLGANAVHMTLLHELIALAADLYVGRYRVFTNNLHVYTELPDYARIMETNSPVDHYRDYMLHYPLLSPREKLIDFLTDAEDFVLSKDGFNSSFRTGWFRDVAQPMARAYDLRRKKEDETDEIDKVRAEDWKLAAMLWKEWKSE